MNFLRSYLLLLCLALFAGLGAQIINPVSWETRVLPLTNGEYELQVVARMDEGWAIYSQYTEDGGPVPTTLAWSEDGHFELLGKTTEAGHKKEGLDDMFGVDVIKFLSDEDVVFGQKIKVFKYGEPINVVLEYMACDDEQCLPPTEEYFTFKVDAPLGETTKDEEALEQVPPNGAVNDVQEEEVLADKVAAPTQDLTPATEETTENTDRTPTELANFSVTEPPATEADPVTWTLEATQLTATEWLIEASAEIEPEWTLYGQALDPDIGPVPTAFVIEEEGLSHLGEVAQDAEKRKIVFEDVWEAEVPKLYDGVIYSQRIKVEPNTEKVSGYITYMACKEVCLPPEDLPFSLNLTDKIASIGYEEEAGNIAIPPVVAQGGSGECSLDFNNEPVANCNEGAAETKGKSLFTIFGLGFLGGLFALIMPCIFPMIPLTVNFFNKGGKDRKGGVKSAGLYGLFIFGIYVLLSVPFHLVEGVSANILNDVASNVPLNIFFFAVFMFFAGSFFGYYELTLPSSWTNSSASKENSGGIVGIFFMALTLALVSFSCTGPILGSLLVGTASEGAMPLTAGMAGFGLALALPFTLFAAFPQMLQAMPSSGGWLNSVKVVLGFLEVALAFKFLSTADLVGEWDFLKIELFYAIWILCFLGIAIYLFGLISFPHDSKNRKPGPLAFIFGAAAIAFAGYLVTGYNVNEELDTYHPLSLMSGLAPPVGHSFLYPNDCPQGIPCFKDLDEGLAYACENDKPVMLDFTGWSCTNCRDMEENVWSKDDIRNRLTEDFVLISLYVDDRSELPEEEHQVVDRLDSPGKKMTINKVGKKWHYLEQSVYQKSTQPYYVLISPDGQTLNPPVSYTPDVGEYAQFLECGLSTYRALSSKEGVSVLESGK
ncbi:hypothetical protein CEQ90_02860 [Lewinellaceae bacterium SD302]|nr:hypothetical protein CEQ90_02860 [Lewinellaceae bacterium SD302]